MNANRIHRRIWVHASMRPYAKIRRVHLRVRVWTVGVARRVPEMLTTALDNVKMVPHALISSTIIIVRALADSQVRITNTTRENLSAIVI